MVFSWRAHTPHFDTRYAHLCSVPISGQRETGHELAEDIRPILRPRARRRLRLRLRLRNCFCHVSQASHTPWLAIGAIYRKRAWWSRLSRVGTVELPCLNPMVDCSPRIGAQGSRVSPELRGASRSYPAYVPHFILRSRRDVTAHTRLA
jgi:hypothetical protein